MQVKGSNQEGNTRGLVFALGEVKQGLLQQPPQEENRSLRTLFKTWPRKGIQRGALPVAWYLGGGAAMIGSRRRRERWGCLQF
ncbi:hypothetical protein V6N13_026095 [Hibiscus sabdariffa]|uniref:Uncharacterized protein n=2 Tax=Hibiscus sabdariffa TaxID=183260 RepID=A0ABR2AQ07_9ROSI